MKYCIWLLICLYCVALSASAENNAVVFPERNVGYTIGDFVEQTISLNTDSSALPLSTLAETQRVGRWLSRQKLDVNDNNNTLTIRYQIINAPAYTRVISLPALSLGDDQSTALNTPSWSFTISPLIPASQEAEDSPLPLMQDDDLAKVPDTTSRAQHIKLLIYVLLISLLLWLVWWLIRGIRDAQLLPFARAYQTIRKHRVASDKHASEPWLVLHEAFNRAGGRHIGLDSIDTLLRSKQWLKPFEQDIRTFFEHSSSRFFAQDSSANSSNQTLDLAGFSKSLYKAEKSNTDRHEKPAHRATAVA